MLLRPRSSEYLDSRKVGASEWAEGSKGARDLRILPDFRAVSFSRVAVWRMGGR